MTKKIKKILYYALKYVFVVKTVRTKTEVKTPSKPTFVQAQSIDVMSRFVISLVLMDLLVLECDLNSVGISALSTVDSTQQLHRIVF